MGLVLNIVVETLAKQALPNSSPQDRTGSQGIDFGSWLHTPSYMSIHRSRSISEHLLVAESHSYMITTTADLPKNILRSSRDLRRLATGVEIRYRGTYQATSVEEVQANKDQQPQLRSALHWRPS